jgi:ribosome maturation factor RimP
MIEEQPPVEGDRDIAVAFERSVAALAYDAAFRDIEIVDRRARKAGRVHELSLVIDREGGVDLETCGRIATRLNAELERFTDDFELVVTSAGLERPLLRPADYERFRDRDVVVKTTLAVHHEYTHEGKLAGLRGTTVILNTKKGELPIPYEMVKSAHLVHDYRADLRRAKKEKRERGT